MSARRPLIGLTPDQEVPEGQPTEAQYLVRSNYAGAVLAAGGIPVILPYAMAAVADFVAGIDGFLITGGTPGVSVKPRRSEFERALIAAALDAKRPVLGICNGMQMIGLHLGGALIECIKDEVAQPIDHIPFDLPTITAHDIRIAPQTRLAALAGAEQAQVNSLHRQAIGGVGRFTVAATALDGVAEAIEGQGPGFCLGLQWHPEYGLTALDTAIFDAFVSAAMLAR